MQNIQEQLTQLTKTLNPLLTKDILNIEDAKQLKQWIVISDKVSEMLKTELNQIEQIRLKATKQLSTKIEKWVPLLNEFEEKFNITYTKSRMDPPGFEKKIHVNIGNNIIIPILLYSKKELIPIMQYGAILQDAVPLILFNYGGNNFVSITSSQIIEMGGFIDNYRTITCSNIGKCEFGDKCKFMHDPILFPGSNHIQRFTKSPLVKRCPNFGNGNSFHDQVNELDFEQLRSLARYCAYMMLLIGQVAGKNS